MILQLAAHLSYIANKKLHFICSDKPSCTKLVNHCGNNLVPYNINCRGLEFIVSTGRIYEDIELLIGLECIIHVRIISFCFASKFTNNTGMPVKGTRLVLSDIAATGH